MSDPLLGGKPLLEQFRLDGRVGLVTGGGQGIGRASAHALGEGGAAVAVVGILTERAVVYPASEASDFMTGQDMDIDGGYCRW
jgi:NAD(P)-dependent dehydrogenase (short-subunit alcohol dehydrogenase family)